jgi:hypothetical protein
MTYPVFTNGTVLPASDLNAIGLWLVKSQAVGSGVSSVTVTGAFSADYDNYRIIYSGGTSSGSGALLLSLGASTTTYYNAAVYAAYSAGTVGSVSNNNALGYWNYVGAMDSTEGANMDIDLLNPFNSAKYTTFGGSLLVSNVAGSTGGVHKTNASYTSFILGVSTGTLTGGTISVYGYRK